MKKFLFVIFLFVSDLARSQDLNYWPSQVGNTSSLLGGAAINVTFDNSGIYYNPGSLAFVENTGISLSGNAFYFKVYNIINGAGDGINLKNSNLTGAPSLISGVIKNKKHPDLSVTYAIINTEINSTLFSVENNMNYDVILSRPGEEHYVGIYKYNNKTREDWVGFGLGRKFMESTFGIGISQFVTIKYQDYLHTTSATAFEQNIDYSSPLGMHTYYDDFVFRNIGLVWKIGINYQLPKFRIGLVITTPKANVSMLNGHLIRNEHIDIPSQEEFSYKSVYISKTRTAHHTPWVFDLGSLVKKDNYTLYFRCMLATRVKTYSMLKLGKGTQEYINLPPDKNYPFKSMWMAQRPVFNASFGYSRKIKDNLTVLGGLRTDFDAYDKKNLPRKNTYTPVIGYLNLYHLSAGTVWYEKSYRLTVGFSYSMGFSRGDLQQINLTSPSDLTGLYGIPDNSTRTRFDQIAFHFGFTYLFSRIYND